MPSVAYNIVAETTVNLSAFFKTDTPTVIRCLCGQLADVPINNRDFACPHCARKWEVIVRQIIP